MQWGRPIGTHAAISQKISFIAATSFALEAVLDLSAHMADEGRNDIRIEAALAKLWSSEMSWLIADELVQIRGGRGYETADSLRARGERGVPAEQVLRDLRINRIFEGSTEIMHLIVAREAVDAHLSVAGDIIDPETSVQAKAKAAARAGVFYGKWLPQLVAGAGQLPSSYAEFGSLAPHLRYVERASRRLAPVDVLRDGALAGRSGAPAGVPRPRRRHRRGAVRDLGDGGAGGAHPRTVALPSAAGTPAADGDSAYELADTFARQSRLRVERLFDALWNNTDSRDAEVAKDVLADRYTWVEAGILDPAPEGRVDRGRVPGAGHRRERRAAVPAVHQGRRLT